MAQVSLPTCWKPKPEEKPKPADQRHTESGSEPSAAAPSQLPQQQRRQHRTPSSTRQEKGIRHRARPAQHRHRQRTKVQRRCSISPSAKTQRHSSSQPHRKKEETNGVYAVTTDSDGPPTALLSGKGKYQRLTWDEDNTQLAFTSDKEDAEAKQPKFRVYHWNRKDPQATEIVSITSAGFPQRDGRQRTRRI